MTQLTIGIVEDEVLIAEGINFALQQIGYATLRPAYNYAQALQLLATAKPDLLIIDVSLNDTKDGIHLAAEINQKHHVPFIFLTGNTDPETIERAKAVKPLAYLVKPFEPNDLFTSIEIAFNNYNAGKQAQTAAAALPDAIFIKASGLFHKVNLSEILHVSSDNIYLNIHTKAHCYVARMKLEEFLAEYAHANFFRIHRSHAINLKHLETIAPSSVMVGGTEVPMNKTYKEDLMLALQTLK